MYSMNGFVGGKMGTKKTYWKAFGVIQARIEEA